MRSRIAQLAFSAKSTLVNYAYDMYAAGGILIRIAKKLYPKSEPAKEQPTDDSQNLSDAIIKKKIEEAKEKLEEKDKQAIKEGAKEAGKEKTKEIEKNEDDKAVKDAISLGTLAKKVIENEELQETTHSTLDQVIEGASPTAMTALPKAAFRYPESRGVMWSTLWRGLVSYGAPVVIYRAGIRPVLTQAVEGTYAAYPFYALEFLTATLYFIRAGNNIAIDMLINGVSIGKTTTPPAEAFKRDNDLLQPCPEECGALVNQQASLMAYLNSMAALRAVRLVDYTASTLLLSADQPIVPILGTIASYPFLRLIEGRIFVGYKLAAVGMCSKHREAILDANHGYCFGKGLSYHLTLKALNYLAAYGMSYLIESMTGVQAPVVTTLFANDFFVNDALSYLVALSFSVAETQVNNVLPGKEKGKEIFYYPNKAVEASVTWIIDKVTLAFKPKEPEKKDALESKEVKKTDAAADTQLVKVHGKKAKKEDQSLDFALTKPIANFWQSDPVQMLLTFVNSDLLSLDRFLQRRSFDHFARIYSKTLHDNIHWFKNLRKGRWPRFILEMVPEAFVSSSSREILLTLRKKRWDEPVEYIDKIIHRICPTEFSHLPHVGSSSAFQDMEERTKEVKEIDPETASALQLVLAAKESAPVAEVLVPSIAPSSVTKQVKEDSSPKDLLPKENPPELSQDIAAPASRLMGGVKKRKLPAKLKNDEENPRASSEVLAILGKKDD